MLIIISFTVKELAVMFLMLNTGRQLQSLYVRMQTESCLSLHQSAKRRLVRAELFA